MTVEVYSGPSDPSWQSTLFSATVNGAAAFVYGLSQTCWLGTNYWSSGATMVASWFTYGADAATTVVVTRLAGAITSAAVYPPSAGATAEIAGGLCTLTVPLNTRLRVEFNGDRKDVLHIFASPLKATVPASTTAWTTLQDQPLASINDVTDTFTTSTPHGLSNGRAIRLRSTVALPSVLFGATPGVLDTLDVYYVRDVGASTFKLALTPGGDIIGLTNVGSGVAYFQVASWEDTVNCLYFGPGVHTLGRGFQLAAGTRVYLDGGAVVIGSLHLLDSGITVEGPGVLAGTFMLPHDLYLLYPDVSVAGAFLAKARFTMLHGTIEEPFINEMDNAVQGITIVASPFYTTYRAATTWTNVHVLAAWHWNCDGIDTIAKHPLLRLGSITDCFMFVGDDAVKALGSVQEPDYLLVTGCFTVNAQGSGLFFGYTPNHLVTTLRLALCSDNDAMTLGVPDDTSPHNVARGYNAIFKCWASGTANRQSYGRFGVRISDLRVCGPVPCRLFSFRNPVYPWDHPTATGRYGQISYFGLDDVVVDETPAQLSLVEGYNQRNTPYRILTTGLDIAGTRVTARNWLQFVEHNAFPYRIYVDGVPVTTEVQLCNLALSHLGQKPSILAIEPPDGSVEAGYCVAFYDQAVHTLLELRNWNFATKRVALTLYDVAEDSDTDAWQYAYALPSGILKALSVHIPGSTDDYSTGGVRQPQPFAIELNEDGVQVIYCNVEDAVLRFTAYITDPNAFPPLFQQALTWFLASMLAGPLLKGEVGDAAAKRAIAMANGYLAQASVSDASQRDIKPEINPTWIQLR